MQQVLLVDNDAKSQRVIEVSLKKAGYVVTTAVNGVDALEKVKLQSPDLVISDTRMPEMDGFELRERLKKDPTWASIPFIFLTAQRNIQDKIRGLELGVDDYLTKPIYVKEVVTRVKILLEKQDRRRLERRDERGSFDGQLSEMGIIDLIQTVDLSRKSGRIRLTASGRAGDISFRDGKIVDASLGGAVGEDAFYRLLRWNEGEFAIEFDPPGHHSNGTPDRIRLSTQALLMEGMRQVEEWDRLREQAPSLNSVVDIDHGALLDKLAEIPDEVNPLLRQLDGRQSLESAIEQSGVEDVKALAFASKLFFEGLLFDSASRVHQVAASAPAPQRVTVTADGDDGDWGEALSAAASAASPTGAAPAATAAPAVTDSAGPSAWEAALAGATLRNPEATAPVTPAATPGNGAAPDTDDLVERIRSSQSTLSEGLIPTPSLSAEPQPETAWDRATIGVTPSEDVAAAAAAAATPAPVAEAAPAPEPAPAAPAQAPAPAADPAPAAAAAPAVEAAPAPAPAPTPAAPTPSIEVQPEAAAPAPTPSVEVQPQTPSVEIQPQTPSVEVQPQAPSVEVQPQTPSVEVQPQAPAPAAAAAPTPSAEVQPQGAAEAPASAATVPTPSAEVVAPAPAVTSPAPAADAAPAAAETAPAPAANDAAAAFGVQPASPQQGQQFSDTASAFFDADTTGAAPGVGAMADTHDDFGFEDHDGGSNTGLIIGVAAIVLAIVATLGYIAVNGGRDSGQEPAVKVDTTEKATEKPPAPKPEPLVKEKEEAKAEEGGGQVLEFLPGQAMTLTPRPPGVPPMAAGEEGEDAKTEGAEGAEASAASADEKKAEGAEAAAGQEKAATETAAGKEEAKKEVTEKAAKPEKKPEPVVDMAAYRAAIAQGKSRYNSGDLKGALSAYRRAVKTNPKGSDGYVGLGQVYFDQNDGRRALRNLRKAVRYNSRNAQAQLLMGGVYQAQENIPKACKAYARYLRLAPNGKYASEIPAIQASIGCK